jgi:hypothetical protein
MSSESIQDIVKDRYARAARRVAAGESGCCGPASSPCCDPISSDLYEAKETEGLPEDAVSASLGCGNPTALAGAEGRRDVLDLGSGGGIDVCCRPGASDPAGQAYGST